MFPELDIKVLAKEGIGDLQFIPRVSLKTSSFARSLVFGISHVGAGLSSKCLISRNILLTRCDACNRNEKTSGPSVLKSSSLVKVNKFPGDLDGLASSKMPFAGLLPS